MSLLRKLKKLFSVSRLFRPFLKSLNLPLTTLTLLETLLFVLDKLLLLPKREDTESSLAWIGLTVEEARLGDEFPMIDRWMMR